MIETISGLLTPLIAIITVLILYWQFRLERNRWRLALYDKRYPVYLSTREYLCFIIQHATMTQEELDKFQRNSKDKEFLFGVDVKKYLDELYSKGNQLMRYTRRLQKGNIEEEKRIKLIDDEENLNAWFRKQFEVSKKLFGEYLAIDKK